MHKSPIEKTAFSPGPGYGLTGATQTCQRGLDEIFRECHDCADNYVDDIIVFSDEISFHKADLWKPKCISDRALPKETLGPM